MTPCLKDWELYTQPHTPHTDTHVLVHIQTHSTQPHTATHKHITTNSPQTQPHKATQRHTAVCVSSCVSLSGCRWPCCGYVWCVWLHVSVVTVSVCEWVMLVTVQPLTVTSAATHLNHSRATYRYSQTRTAAQHRPTQRAPITPLVRTQSHIPVASGK